MRARLAASERPERIFAVVLECAKRAGLVGRRRVLDSTALYDAVATIDPQARGALVDELAKDAHAVLVVLDGRGLEAALVQAAGVLAAVVGQDFDEDAEGVCAIARRVAKDRVRVCPMKCVGLG